MKRRANGALSEERARFERDVPWGRALLERLAREGFTPS